MKDEAGNVHFTVGDNTYKLPKLNWKHEERFLIAAKQAGIDFTSENQDYEVDLFSENGIKLRETILPWLFVSVDSDSYKQLTPDVQDAHFNSVIEVYSVLAKEIEVIASFLAQWQQSSQLSSAVLPEKDSEGQNTQIKRKVTSRA